MVLEKPLVGESEAMNGGTTTATFRSILDKPLEHLTEDDISQLTRADCRRFLKENGMRRPSWNKAQAIQQVIALKAVRSKGKIYDVFLSFRGEDSRAKFISHLYASLLNAGIFVFRDDDEIKRGDMVSDSLKLAISKSIISIVVLSKHYANSKWCMLELLEIMKERRTTGLVVVPVFYEVDPSDVRHQTGEFGKAFEDLIKTTSLDEQDIVRNWRTTLLEVGGIAGVVIINSR